MLKTRLIGIVLVKNAIAVQSIGFQRYLPIGTPEIAINYLDRWGVDEIMVLHLDAMANKTSPSIEQVKSYASQCQVPLSVGGGITDISDIKKIIRSGADKVVINSSLLTHPHIITEGSDLFGQQSIVVSLDVRKIKDDYFVYTHNGKTTTHQTVEMLAQKAIELGTGELLVTSIDQDGKKQGYDLNLIQLVSKNSTVPIIACGGAGHPNDIHLAIKNGASACAVGNMFHFTEHSVIVTKQFLNLQSDAIRLDSDVNYHAFHFDHHGRPTKLDDSTLEHLRFQYFVEEVI